MSTSRHPAFMLYWPGLFLYVDTVKKPIKLIVAKLYIYWAHLWTFEPCDSTFAELKSLNLGEIKLFHKHTGISRFLYLPISQIILFCFLKTYISYIFIQYFKLAVTKQTSSVAKQHMTAVNLAKVQNDCFFLINNYKLWSSLIIFYIV